MTGLYVNLGKYETLEEMRKLVKDWLTWVIKDRKERIKKYGRDKVMYWKNDDVIVDEVFYDNFNVIELLEWILNEKIEVEYT